jgi:hypothetical protein
VPTNYSLSGAIASEYNQPEPDSPKKGFKPPAASKAQPGSAGSKQSSSRPEQAPVLLPSAQYVVKAKPGGGAAKPSAAVPTNYSLSGAIASEYNQPLPDSPTPARAKPGASDGNSSAARSGGQEAYPIEMDKTNQGASKPGERARAPAPAPRRSVEAPKGSQAIEWKGLASTHEEFNLSPEQPRPLRQSRDKGEPEPELEPEEEEEEEVWVPSGERPAPRGESWHDVSPLSGVL